MLCWTGQSEMKCSSSMREIFLDDSADVYGQRLGRCVHLEEEAWVVLLLYSSRLLGNRQVFVEIPDGLSQS